MAQGFVDLLTQILSKQALPSTPRNVIRLAHDPEARQLDLLVQLERNPVYGEMLLRMPLIEKAKSKWEQPDQFLTTAVNLLGKTGTRNAVGAIGVARTITSGLPKKKADKFSVDPSIRTKRAIEAEETCQTLNFSNADLAWTAGIYYDLLMSQLESSPTLPKEAKNYLEDVWKDSLKKAKVAYAIAARMKSLKGGEFTFSFCLLIGLGKVMMAILFPNGATPKSWKDFQAECLKLETTRRRDFTWFSENKTFPVNHAQLASIAITYSNLFNAVPREALAAIRHYCQPYYLADKSKDWVNLATILGLAQNASETHFQSWLKTLGLSEADFRMIERKYQ